MPIIIEFVENIIFKYRAAIIGLFAAVTLFMGWEVYTRLHPDTGFDKNLPLKHEYMRTYIKHERQFGGANNLMIAVRNKEGDIFNPDVFDVIRNVTDELFFIEGVDRGLVQSIFTPNVRYTEVVEDGFEGGPVVSSDFQNTPEGIENVRENILKAGIVGRLVSNDFTSAMIYAQLMDINPSTHERLDYIDFSRRLEKKIRDRYKTDDIDIHIVGFAKVTGDVADAIPRVIVFFGVTILITFILVYLYSHSVKLAVLPIFCSIVGVLWQLGLISLLGFGLDPMSILVPFLIFAIGVSHGMQMINAMGNMVGWGASPMDAARASFRRLLVPGSVALVSDAVGFLTLFLIKIQVIQDLAVTASIGVAVIILTNLFLLPLLMSLLTFPEGFRKRMGLTENFQETLWNGIAVFAKRSYGAAMILFAMILALIGLHYARQMQVGDLHEGVAVLHEDSRYNRDNSEITRRFSIGTDIISVIVETGPDACIDYDIMTTMDRFHWHMENVDGVQSVVSLPKVAKVVNAGFNEGSLKWKTLPRNESMLIEATRPIPSSTGLLNSNCSVMPVMIFTRDHKAKTIEHIVDAVKAFVAANPSDQLTFHLATGQVGVMAATNESVKAAQIPMLLWVYGAVIGLCLLTFRSLPATICVIVPLAVVSILAQALMTLLEIGLTVHTLPVIALGVGIGVDYGIYLISPLRDFLKQDLGLRKAYLETLKTTGSAVLFTGLTLAVGVGTWFFSALKFQKDIGIILSFMFLLNMLGAIFLLPAISSVFWDKKTPEK